MCNRAPRVDRVPRSRNAAHEHHYAASAGAGEEEGGGGGGSRGAWRAPPEPGLVVLHLFCPPVRVLTISSTQTSSRIHPGIFARKLTHRYQGKMGANGVKLAPRPPQRGHVPRSFPPPPGIRQLWLKHLDAISKNDGRQRCSVGAFPPRPSPTGSPSCPCSAACRHGPHPGSRSASR
jgi:hypothetical protein